MTPLQAQQLVGRSFSSWKLPEQRLSALSFDDLPFGVYSVLCPALSSYPVAIHKQDGVEFGANESYMRLPDGREFTGADVGDKWLEFYLATKSHWDYERDFSHYDYLDVVLEEFAPLVFGEDWERHIGKGMISSHGDKSYSYQSSALHQHGIPKWHTAMLHLLTYTKMMDRPKPDSYAWIIDNYPRFKGQLNEAQRRAGI